MRCCSHSTTPKTNLNWRAVILPCGRDEEKVAVAQQLLQTAEEDGFDVLVTGDQTLSYEQNLARRRLAIVVLSTVEWRIVKDFLMEIVAAVDCAAPGSA